MSYRRGQQGSELSVQTFGHRVQHIFQERGTRFFARRFFKSRVVPFRRHSHARIEAVATDMSPAYIAAVLEHLPNALLVFDRFHVVKLFHHELSDLRRELDREATDLLNKQVLKGTRWLLLKKPENLSEQ